MMRKRKGEGRRQEVEKILTKPTQVSFWAFNCALALVTVRCLEQCVCVCERVYVQKM